MSRRTLTILVPALNEEARIASTVSEALAAARAHLDEFELIAVDDGSTDRTGEVLDGLAAGNPEMRVVHNPSRRGLSWSFRYALEQARFPYMTLIPGDRAYRADGIERLFRAVGAADLVISYRTNQFRNRPAHRVLLSLLYKRLMGSVLFRFSVLDYHSMVVFPVERMRALGSQAEGYAFQVEALVNLLRSGVTPAQVPVTLHREDPGSHSLKLRTLTDVGRAIWRLRPFGGASEV